MREQVAAKKLDTNAAAPNAAGQTPIRKKARRPVDRPFHLDVGHVRSGKDRQVRQQAEAHGLYPDRVAAYAKELRRWVLKREPKSEFVSRDQAIEVMMDYAAKRDDRVRAASFYAKLWGLFVLADKIRPVPRHLKPAEQQSPREAPDKPAHAKRLECRTVYRVAPQIAPAKPRQTVQRARPRPPPGAPRP